MYVGIDADNGKTKFDDHDYSFWWYLCCEYSETNNHQQNKTNLDKQTNDYKWY